MFRKLLLFYAFLFLTSCSAPTAHQTAPSPPAATKDNTPSKTVQIEASLTVTPIAAKNLHSNDVQPSTTPTPSCAAQSPLAGISLDELSEIVSNPYQQPRPGMDDGHHGVDFAFYQYKTWTSIARHELLPVFPGKVAGITNDLPPYGNMLIIETDLQLIDFNFQNYPTTDIQEVTHLRCSPFLNPPVNILNQEYSLFTLYAHLAESPPFEIGDQITSDQVIGLVGNTGMSGNPHLHLEMRIGPKDAHFLPMGHYANDLPVETMDEYCEWRVSNWFALNDPMDLLDSTSLRNN